MVTLQVNQGYDVQRGSTYPDTRHHEFYASP